MDHVNSDSVQDRPLICLLMIVKNEQDVIEKTLESCLPYVDTYAILDTGSTDRTMEIIQEVTGRHAPRLHGVLKQEQLFGPGEDPTFDVMRNRNIEIGEELSPVWFLHMDANDELRNGEILRQHCTDTIQNQDEETRPNPSQLAFHVRMRWNELEFYMARLFRANHGFRFVGPIHEYLHLDGVSVTQAVPSDCHIFHDRVADEHKSQKRYERDCRILEREVSEHPQRRPDRNFFYLAQSYASCGRSWKAFKAYRQRCKIQGWFEETYQAMERSAQLAASMDMRWGKTMSMLLEAYEYWPFAQGYRCGPRCEPLVMAAKHYMLEKKFNVAEVLLSHACDLEFPHNSKLFVNRHPWDFDRYFQYSIAAYYGDRDVGRRCGIYERGKYMAERSLEVCRAKKETSPGHASQYGPLEDACVRNLAFYTDRASTDRASTDRASTDRASTDQASTDQASTDPDQASTDQASTDARDLEKTRDANAWMRVATRSDATLDGMLSAKIQSKDEPEALEAINMTWEYTLEYYLNAYDADPARTQPLVCIGKRLKEKKMWHAAMVFLKRAYELDETSFAASFNLGIVAWYAHQKALGKKAAQRATLLDPSSAQAAENLRFYDEVT